MLTVAEARERVLAAIETVVPVELPLRDAVGLALADDAVAPHDLPRFDNSAMDGFAVRATDVRGASEEQPVALALLGESRAGDPGDAVVGEGSAARIMTGAPLPPGADAIVPVEVADEEHGKVIVRKASERGQHVRSAGEDLRSGDRVVEAGSELGAGELAVLASLGLSPLRVFPRPKVWLLVTGDELVDPEDEPGPGQIRDSNTLALRTLISAAGAEVTTERVPDRADDVDASFRRASEGADLIVSSGGVSVGKYDFVKDAIERLGRLDMWRVAMQPGKPVVLGSVGSTPFLGLPGNPVSVHIGFEQFVRPAIRKMRGCNTLLRPVVKAKLSERIEKRPGRLHFVRVRLSLDGSRWIATPSGAQGSHIQTSLVGTDGVARFALEATELAAGAEVEVEVWRLPEL